jgi:hypothetical protein
MTELTEMAKSMERSVLLVFWGMFGGDGEVGGWRSRSKRRSSEIQASDSVASSPQIQARDLLGSISTPAELQLDTKSTQTSKDFEY